MRSVSQNKFAVSLSQSILTWGHSVRINLLFRWVRVYKHEVGQSEQTCCFAESEYTNMRSVSQNKLAVSLSQSILTWGQSVLTLTYECQVPGHLAASMTVYCSHWYDSLGLNWSLSHLRTNHDCGGINVHKSDAYLPPWLLMQSRRQDKTNRSPHWRPPPSFLQLSDPSCHSLEPETKLLFVLSLMHVPQNQVLICVPLSKLQQRLSKITVSSRNRTKLSCLKYYKASMRHICMRNFNVKQIKKIWLSAFRL